MNSRPTSVPCFPWSFARLLTLLAGAATVPAVVAQVPALISYQGVLRNATDGTPYSNASPTVYFQIFGDETDDSLLYTESATVNTDVNGLFNLSIGTKPTTNSMPLADVFARQAQSPDGPAFLQLQVGGTDAGVGGAVILPRLQFQSAPYAFVAQYASKAFQNFAVNATLSSSDLKVSNGITSQTLTVTGTATVNSLVVANGLTLQGGTITLPSLTVTGEANLGSLAVNNAGNFGSLKVTNTLTVNNLVSGPGSSFSNLVVGVPPTALVVYQNGFVGMGMQPDGSALLSVGSPKTSYSWSGSLFSNEHSTGKPITDTYPFSIHATSWILSDLGFAAASDSRTKRSRGRSDPSRDLQALVGIEVVDYTMIDTVARGSAPIKKVIAQQLETVYPQAVSRGKDVVPDLYAKSEAVKGWISVDKSVEPVLKIGDRVQLITENGKSLHEVLEVSGDSFRVGDIADGPVFVYGREVSDFRRVDYDAVAMLNVSATQELHRLLKLQMEEIRSLKSQVADLLARDREQAARFTALENLVREGSRSVRQANLR